MLESEDDLIVLVYIITRLINLLEFPLFSDEAFYLVRADEILNGASIWAPLYTATQPMFVWLTAFFQILFFQPILAGRMVSVISGLATMLILKNLAGKWYGFHMGWLAAGLYICLPLTLVHDRLALLDGLTTAFIALSIINPLVGISLAILTKATGWLAVPLAGLYFLYRPSKRQFGKILVSILSVLLVWTLVLKGSNEVLNRSILKPGEHLSFSLKQTVSNIYLIKFWSFVYITIPLLGVFILGTMKILAELIYHRKLTKIGVIAVWCIGAMVFCAAVGRDLFPRYLTPLSIGVILVSVDFFHWLRQRIRRSWWYLLTVVVFLPLVRFDAALLSQPKEAPLVLEDKFQYYHDWTSGIGMAELVQVIKRAVQDHPNAVVYLEEENSYYVGLKFELRSAKTEIKIADWLKDPLKKIPSSVLDRQYPVFFIRNRHPDIPEDWPVELIFSFPKSPFRSVFVYQIKNRV